MPVEQPILRFQSAEDWEAWLSENHDGCKGIWLRIFKKDSGEPTVSYAEALDAALCYGWIDGQKKTHDAQSWLQKFTPRRPRSIWSKVNTGHVERLIEAGRMKTPGMREVETARRDGRWQAAYDSPSQMTVPEDFLRELEANPEAKAFFQTLNKSNTYAIAWRLQTAKKPETREKRKREILEMLAQGRKFH